MNIFIAGAIVLIAAGILGLVYTHFSFTKDTHEAAVGPFALAVKQKQIVNIPTMAGVVSIVAGVVLLLVSLK